MPLLKDHPAWSAFPDYWAGARDQYGAKQWLYFDTILYVSSELVSHERGLFILMMMMIFFVLGFIVPSSSGLAVLAMPIMAPLADTVHIPRYIVVTAYQFGQYAMLFLAPTGLVMATPDA